MLAACGMLTLVGGGVGAECCERHPTIRSAGTQRIMICLRIDQQVIRQTCLSSHFGMIGQRFPTVDEPVRCITAIITPPGFGCKGLFSRVFRLPPPATCATVPGTRPRVGDVSQERCHATVQVSVLTIDTTARPPGLRGALVVARSGRCGP